MRHTVAGFLSKNFFFYRNLSPTQKFQFLGLAGFFKTCFFCFKALDWEEELANTIITLFKFTNKITSFLFKKVMADLKKNSNSISSLTRSIFTSTMLQFFNNAKSIINNFVRFTSINVYNCTNSTVIVFKAWLIKSFSFHLDSKKAKGVTCTKFLVYMRPLCRL